MESLKSDKHILDWQHKQANDSLRLYYFYYLGKTDSRTAKVVVSQSMPEIIQETKRLIRLKHYAFSWILCFRRRKAHQQKVKMTNDELCNVVLTAYQKRLFMPGGTLFDTLSKYEICRAR